MVAETTKLFVPPAATPLRPRYKAERKVSTVAYVLVFLGAGLGGALRHGTNVLTARMWGLNFPFGTLTVNLVGSFAMAVLMELFAARAGLPQSTRLFLTTGVLGGFTTFSTFTLDAMGMIERQEWLMAIFYLTLSVAGGIAAFIAGVALTRMLLGAQ
ncbi:fluoride efflux transporter CrcB [Devosia sp. PTR5]|uniref:Fluoride-specific ion channel FluC n=1 Tax=Devosia oryzisoli TaxID=2774138 RepID=A0A927FRM3_9HYPH|nr:fluoride efflux transporter CrcB [Devosia oryzisoli]